ncbi:hypothetical protein E2C01_026946 [Portunus trituberculatus]|uniref:Uncharacterized protein n=1 Tax=Portunus trituberculatus TaxID=210409 RepID=A0A5B7EGN1_PORTR|nr:hypothetical protein [Portunus trituberculatus]
MFWSPGILGQIWISTTLLLIANTTTPEVFVRLNKGLALVVLSPLSLSLPAGPELPESDANFRWLPKENFRDFWHLAKNISNNFTSSSFPPLFHPGGTTAMKSVSKGIRKLQPYVYNETPSKQARVDQIIVHLRRTEDLLFLRSSIGLLSPQFIQMMKH